MEHAGGAHLAGCIRPSAPTGHLYIHSGRIELATDYSLGSESMRYPIRSDFHEAPRDQGHFTSHETSYQPFLNMNMLTIRG